MSYQDHNIILADGTLTIKHYYFPSLTSKKISQSEIDNVYQIHLGLLDKWRMWGTGENGHNITHWYNADITRLAKHWALIITVNGSSIQPVITPDRPDELLAALKSNGVRVEKNEKTGISILTEPKGHAKNAKEPADLKDSVVLTEEHKKEVEKGNEVPVDNLG